MCRELVQGYERWLNDILLILDAVCEDVVPAGKPDEDIYRRTKKLYEDAESLAREGKKAELESLLNLYREDGQRFLQQFEQEWSWRKWKASFRNEKAVGCDSKSVDNRVKEWGDKSQLLEETRILLRRKYARDIAGSLQMLANLAFLLEVYFDYSSADVKKLFELSDKTDKYEVKKVRPGVVVDTRYVQASTRNLKFA